MSAPGPTISAELKALLRRVKLGKAIDTLPERLALARTGGMGHAEFLELVLADEVTRRETISARVDPRRLQPEDQAPLRAHHRDLRQLQGRTGGVQRRTPVYGGEATTHPDHWGAVRAFDPASGREVWEWKNDKPMVASVLATGGDLVFAGEPTGEFDAYDARSGELLWQHQTASGHHSSPVSNSVKDKQYVAVPVGWGGWVKGFAPGASECRGEMRSWSSRCRRR